MSALERSEEKKAPVQQIELQGPVDPEEIEKEVEAISNNFHS